MAVRSRWGIRSVRLVQRWWAPCSMNWSVPAETRPCARSVSAQAWEQPQSSSACKMLPQMSSIRFEVDANGIALVSMDVPQRSMNVLTAALIQDLRQALELIASTDTIRGAILTSGKASGFLAGGDLTDLVNAFDSGMTA